MEKVKFRTGRLVATRAVADRIEEDPSFYSFCALSIDRHFKGDWGELDEEDKRLNDEALTIGERLLSKFVFFKTGEEIFIITERDRSVTTILYPSDY